MRCFAFLSTALASSLARVKSRMASSSQKEHRQRSIHQHDANAPASERPGGHF